MKVKVWTQNIHWLPLFFDEAVAGLVPGRGGISPWRTDTRGKLVIRSLSERPAIMGTKNINIKSKPQSTSCHSMKTINSPIYIWNSTFTFCKCQKDPNIWCFPWHLFSQSSDCQKWWQNCLSLYWPSWRQVCLWPGPDWPNISSYKCKSYAIKVLTFASYIYWLSAEGRKLMVISQAPRLLYPTWLISLINKLCV